jgi:hypothetical protein
MDLSHQSAVGVARPAYAPSPISSNSWCQKSLRVPVLQKNHLEGQVLGVLPHRPLIVPLSPRHSERSPESATLTLAPITASSDLIRNPRPPIPFLR